MSEKITPCISPKERVAERGTLPGGQVIMHIRGSLTTARTLSAVSTLLATRRRKDALLFVVLFSALLGLTPLLILSGMTVGFSLVFGILAVLLLTISIVRWPSLSLFVVAGCVFLVEQEPLSTPILTDNLFIFHWPTQLEGFVERPIGVLILFSLAIWVIHQLAQRRQLLRGGALLIPFSLFMLCVIGGALYGLVSGGDLKIIVVEVRPLWYLFISYLMAYNFVTQKGHIRTFFWLAILCAGVKALQGLYIYLIALHGDLQGIDTIMSHEESFFFAALLLLIIILCLCHRYRPQLFAALLVAPAVLVAMVVNQRRTDYVALLVGVGVAWVLVFLIRPKARKSLVVGLLICVVLGTGYVIAFAHASGTLAEPARAIISVFNPAASDVRDATSNLYRIYEDNDLKYTVKQYPLGLGFGKPFLQPQPLTSIFPNIIDFDPYYNYVPHNTIYWIWADLGPIGYFALWFLIGAIIVRGCIIVRRLRDPYFQVAAIYIVAVTFMEVVVAFADYQLFFFRNVIYLGLLCGILVKLPILDQQEQQKSQEVLANESTHGVSTSPPPVVGSRNA